MSFDDLHPMELVREYLIENNVCAGQIFKRDASGAPGPDLYFYAQAPQLEHFTTVIWYHASKDLVISVANREFDLHEPDSLQKIVDFMCCEPNVPKVGK